jgi:hypothetical protein
MEILRLLPYQNVEVKFTIPAAYTSNEQFTATITDLADLSSTTQTVTDNAAYVNDSGASVGGEVGVFGKHFCFS